MTTRREEDCIARAAKWGVTQEYQDNAGQVRRTPAETCTALMNAMGVSDHVEEPGVAPTMVVRQGDTRETVVGKLQLEDGGSLQIDHALPPDLPLGYHRLQYEDTEIPVIVVPHQCHEVPSRTWGWAVQLYAARSQTSWGIGDLGDLQRLARWSSGQGAGVVLVNPLNAVSPTEPQEPSPYFPTTRRFLNPLYLDIAEVPGAAEISDKLAPMAQAGVALNADRRIRRDDVLRLKMQSLELIWKHVRGAAPIHDRARCFAIYCVLCEQLGADWRAWPVEYQHPNNEAVEAFAEAHADRVAFHQWIQSALDAQLAAATDALPIVRDLPIGVDPGGADAWEWQDVLARGVSVGAPPDQFNRDGQDWQLSPYIPHRLREAGYAPFIETIRASLEHAGGLRMDHVMGLFRLFWIPPGLGPHHGAYVRYPADDLLGIVALESHRSGAWIAGEDLGTVEPEVRQKLEQQQILSYRLLWFESDPPSTYPEHSLAAVTTHDLPTIAGLWSGADLRMLEDVGLDTDGSGHEQSRLRLVNNTGLAEDASTEAAVEAAYGALAGSPSKVVAVNLDDALLVEDRINIPGTQFEWPNWCNALPLTLEDVESAPVPNRIAASLRNR